VCYNVKVYLELIDKDVLELRLQALQDVWVALKQGNCKALYVVIVHGVVLVHLPEVCIWAAGF
jgi:hypothetical protein